MTVPVIIAVVFIAAWPVAYTVCGLRWDLPGTGWLEHVPWPPLGGILDKLTIPLRYARRPAREHARPLTIRFRVGGELADGTFLHGGDTGPMPAADWDTATPFPQAALPATEAAP